jgi:hypothetical protein
MSLYMVTRDGELTPAMRMPNIRMLITCTIRACPATVAVSTLQQQVRHVSSLLPRCLPRQLILNQVVQHNCSLTATVLGTSARLQPRGLPRQLTLNQLAQYKRSLSSTLLGTLTQFHPSNPLLATSAHPSAPLFATSAHSRPHCLPRQLARARSKSRNSQNLSMNHTLRGCLNGIVSGFPVPYPSSQQEHPPSL